MRIGIPREIKVQENRVALTPDGVRHLITSGAQVIFEKGAGVQAGYDDAAYRKAGARLVSNVREVWSADLVLKVKEPQPSEYRFFRPGLILFTFLHLSANPKLARKLEKKKVKAIAYELVRDDAGHLPARHP